MNKNFSIELFGDLDYEGMVILICYDDEIVAEINYEKGIDKLEMQFVSAQEGSPKQFFLLDDFFDILEKAKNLAIKCANEDEELRKKGIIF